jgi:hypothetical protein
MSEMPLSLVGDLVASPAKNLGEVRGLGRELRLGTRLGTELKQSAAELAQGPFTRRSGAAENVEQSDQHGGQVVSVWLQVCLRVRQSDPVLGRVLPGK